MICMSTKIYFEFRTLSWIYINWSIINLYVTNLKFRIYKAAVNKHKVVTHYLQTQLINSLVVYLSVLQQTSFDDYYYFNYPFNYLNDLNDIQKIFVFKNIYYLKFFWYNKFDSCLLNQQINIHEYNAQILIEFFEKLYIQVLLLSLEPEWLAYYHTNNICFYNIISFNEFLYYLKTNTTFNSASTMYFIKYINLVNFVSNWHPNFVCSRLTSNSVVSKFIKKN